MPSQSDVQKKPYICNLCAALIILIVLGNFIDLCAEGSGISQSLFLFIYSFHMPLLMFLAGSIAKEKVKDKEQAVSGAAYMFLLYLGLKIIIWLVRLIMGGKPNFSLLSESGTPWLFFSLGIYLMVGYLCRNINKQFLLILAVIFALLCGYNTSVGDYLVASRTIVFLPFFVLGQMSDMEKISDLTGSRRSRVIGACILVLALAAMVVFRKQLYVLRPMFTGRNSYKSLGKNAQVKWAYRLSAYGVSILLSWTVFAVIPRRNMGRLISRIGEKFLQIYFWYRPVLYVLTGLQVYERLDQMLGWRMGRVAWVFCGIVVVYLLSIKMLEKVNCNIYRFWIEFMGRYKKVLNDIRKSSDDGILKKFWNSYLSLWKELKGWRLFVFYAVHYSFIFMILWIMAFSGFKEAGKSFICAGDARDLYYTRLLYFNQTIRKGIQSLIAGKGWTIPLYDFTMGPGKMELQLEPIELLAIIWPTEKIESLYTILVILRYYLIGLTFSIFGFYFKRKPLPILIGAISCTFCGYTLYAGVVHPLFLVPLIYLPILIIGLEKVLHGERPYLLIIMIFLLGTYYLYFACMLAILSIIYVCIRFPDIYKKDRAREFMRLLMRLVVSGGIGIAMSGIVVLPTLFQAAGTGRIGRDIWAYTDFYKYADTYYQKFISYFLVASIDAGSWVYLGFSILTLPAIALLFLRKEKKERSLRLIFFIFTAMLMFPFVGYVMSGFNTVNNRWCFAYAFCCAAILMFELPHFLEINRRLLFLITITIVVYLAVCYFVVDTDYYLIDAWIMLVLSVIILLSCRLLSTNWQRTMLVASLVITCFSTWYSAHLKYDPNRGNYVSTFMAKDAAYSDLMHSQYSSFAQSNVGKADEEFYRVIEDTITGVSINSSFFFDVNGVSNYPRTTIFYQSYRDWMYEMEDARRETLTREYGPIIRSPLLTLDSVKYYVLREKDKAVYPYGFEEIDRIQNGKSTDIILENQFALPIGYTYDAYMLRNEYESLNSIEKQEAQLQAVVIDDAPATADLTMANITTTATQVPFQIVEMNNLEWNKGKLKILENGATITLAFNGMPETELYLRMVNFDLTSGANTRRWIIEASTEKTTAEALFCADGYLYSNGYKNQILDLGFSSTGYTTCTIKFPSKGTCVLSDLQIWCQPMDAYQEHICALQEEVLENVKTNWHGLTGKIDVSEDKILCLSIPYDKGWSAFVDGQKVKILRANTAFIGIELEKGSHYIEMKYYPVGWIAGFVLTIIGLIAAIFLFFHLERKNRS